MEYELTMPARLQRPECDAAMCYRVGCCGERYVGMSVERHVAMYLVRHDQNVVRGGDLGQTRQRIAVPHYADRVVWIRQQQHLATLVDYVFEVVEVHLVMLAVCTFQRVVCDFAAVGQRYQTERVIYGRLDDDLVAGFGEDVDDHAYALYYAGNVS